MKVKSKLGLLALGLALAAGSLAGCKTSSGGGSGPIYYEVSWNKVPSIFTVSGINEEGYKKGTTVDFSITLVNPDDYRITSVTSEEVEIQNVQDLDYTFVMPKDDVSIRINYAAIDKYAVEIAEGEEVAGGDPVTYRLTYGSQGAVGSFTIEGDATKVTIDNTLHKVAFLQSGAIPLAFKVNGAVVYNYTANVRAAEEGETRATAITSARAVEIGTALEVVVPEGQTIASKSTDKYYWIKGTITSLYKTDDKGSHYYLDDSGFELYGVKDIKTGVSPEDLIGAKVMLQAKISKFTPNGGSKWIIENDNLFTNVREIDYDTLTGLKLPVEPEYSLQNGTFTLPVKRFPATSTTALTYESNNTSVANVDDNGVVTMLSAGQVKFTVKYGDEITAEGTTEIVDGPAVDRWEFAGAITVDEALALKPSTSGQQTTEKYYVIGNVSAITNTTYGNGNLKNKAGDKSIEIRGMYDYAGDKRYDKMSPQPVADDVIVLYTVIGNYQGNAQLSNGWLVHYNGKSTLPALESLAVSPATAEINVAKSELTEQFTAEPSPTGATFDATKVAWSLADITPAEKASKVSIDAATGVVTAASDAVAEGEEITGKVVATYDNSTIKGEATFSVVNNPAGSKTWYRVAANPEAGNNYRLVLDRENAAQNPGNWYLNGETSGDYYLATVSSDASAVQVTVVEDTNGFKLMLGTKYLQLLKTDTTHVNPKLKDAAADGSVFNIHETLGMPYTTIDSVAWGLGTRSDQNYTTVGGTNFTQYPDNFKVYLECYGIQPVATSMVISDPSATVRQGGSLQLSVSPSPAGSALPDVVTWEITGNSKVHVSEAGLVTVDNDASTEETATVTAKCGELTPVTCTVTVQAAVANYELATTLATGKYVIGALGTDDNTKYYYLGAPTATVDKNPAANGPLSDPIYELTADSAWDVTVDTDGHIVISYTKGSTTYYLEATNTAQGIKIVSAPTANAYWTYDGTGLRFSDGGTRYLASYQNSSFRYYTAPLNSSQSMVNVFYHYIGA